MSDLICIRCASAVFPDPKKEICYKTGGLFCKKLKTIVGKYDPCRIKPAAGKKGGKRRSNRMLEKPLPGFFNHDLAEVNSSKPYKLLDFFSLAIALPFGRGW